MNKERKEQFIANKSKEVLMSNNLGNTFDAAELLEEKYGKDIAEWTTGEIIGFYKYLSTPYIQSLVNIHNSLTGYTNWCVMNGLVRDNQNHFTEITSAALCKCVDLTTLERLIITREDLLRDIKKLNNYCDMMILLGLFEGIPVHDNVLKDVKYSDLDENNILHLKNGVDLKVSSELRSIMETASEETTWRSYSEIRNRETEYFDDGCIIRFTKRSDGSVSVSSATAVIGSRMRKAIQYLGWPVNITMKMVAESGRIHMMREIANSNMVEISETITNLRLRVLHERIYGKIQNQQTWLSTYGHAIGVENF